MFFKLRFYLVELTSDVVFCLVDIQGCHVFVWLLARADCKVGGQRQYEETVPWLIRAVEDETCARTGQLQRGDAGGGEGGEGLRGLVPRGWVVLGGGRLHVCALVLERGNADLVLAVTKTSSEPYVRFIIGEILGVLAGPRGLPEKV